MKIKLKLPQHKVKSNLCCRIYTSRGLRCPECNPVRITIKEQHHD